MKSYKMKINGESYDARIISFDAEQAKIEVNGNVFLVDFEDNNQNQVPKLTRTYKESPGAPQLSVDYADGTVKAPIPGVIVTIKKKVGDRVAKGEAIVILEAMKMESEIEAPAAGVIEEILVKEKAPVHEGDSLVKIKFDAVEEAPAPKAKAPTKHSKPSKAAPMPTSTPVAAGNNSITAPIPGTIIDILVKPGDKINTEQAVIILEAMKMESEVTADFAGTVKKVLVAKGQAVQEGEELIQLGD
jgi:biotin carboxyl carrier protein